MISLAEVQKAALATKPGGVFTIPAGLPGVLSIDRLTGVTLKAEGVVPGLELTRAEDVTVEGVAIQRQADALTTKDHAALRIASSKRVKVVDCDAAFGALPMGVGVAQSYVPVTGDGFDGRVEGLLIGKAASAEFSEDVHFLRGRYHDAHKGIIVAKSRNVTIEDGEVFNVRTSPISGSALGLLRVVRMWLHDTCPFAYGGPGDHGDFVHPWIDRATTEPPEVEVLDCLMDQGSGGGIMGVFCEDNAGIGYAHILVSGNTILSSHILGITLENAAEAAVLGNMLLQAAENPVPGGGAPAIRLLTGSVGAMKPLTSANSAVKVAGNVTADLGDVARLYPGNEWLPRGVRPADELEAARKAAKKRLGRAATAEPEPAPAAPDGRVAELEALIATIRQIAIESRTSRTVGPWDRVRALTEGALNI